ncbi:hypothetical protein KPL39_14975 [Clostridium gasigenes]|uniref:hypothetical protein n=1 Tax=Clostridium gasigenes TaxID=94869 RepID=UPI001C0B3A6C|nr:hypothetical protein [Clostridium gasigenes]MBU3137566.1 hypothetical protein [Clostridium gasigenes]
MQKEDHQERINNLKPENVGQALTSLILKKEYGMIFMISVVIVSLIVPSISFIFLYKRELFNSMDIIKLLILVISINALSSSIFMFINYIIWAQQEHIERESQIDMIKFKSMCNHKLLDKGKALYGENKNLELEQSSGTDLKKYVDKVENLSEEIGLELDRIEKNIDKKNKKIFERSILFTCYIQIVISSSIWFNYIVTAVFKTRYRPSGNIIMKIVLSCIGIIIASLIALAVFYFKGKRRCIKLKKELEAEIECI